MRQVPMLLQEHPTRNIALQPKRATAKGFRILVQIVKRLPMMHLLPHPRLHHPLLLAEAAVLPEAEVAVVAQVVVAVVPAEQAAI